MKNDTIFQDKLDDLKLQMAMQLLGQKELEESEKEIENKTVLSYNELRKINSKKYFYKFQFF